MKGTCYDTSFGRWCRAGYRGANFVKHCSLARLTAFQDAYVLGRLLAHDSTCLDNVAEVMRLYQDVRRPVANEVVHLSRESGSMYQFNHPAYLQDSFSKDPADLKKLGVSIASQFAWATEGGPVHDWPHVEALLMAKGENRDV